MASGLLFRLIRYSRSSIFAAPVGSVRFCAEIAMLTSAGETPCARSAAMSRSTAIWRCLPPAGSGKRVPCTTLSIVRTRWFTWSKISDSLSVSLEKASWRIGTEDAVYRRMIGGMIPGGMRRRMVCEAAVTCAMAAATSAPGWRKSRMTETPS